MMVEYNVALFLLGLTYDEVSGKLIIMENQKLSIYFEMVPHPQY